MDTAVQQKGHPKGLYLLFFTEMWERFSYYGMRGILILYLTKSLMEGGLGIDPQQATLIYGFFTGFVYFTPLIGGWLADNYIGQRKAITIGGVIMMIGQLVLFMLNTQTGLYIGLLLLIIGNGFFKPNISTLVGGLYKDGDPRRDSAFSIFYMGINLGAMIAPLLIGVLTDDIFSTKDGSGKIISYGYRYGFLAAGIGMFLGQILFNTLATKYLGTLGVEPAAKNKNKIVETENKLPEDPKAERQRITVIFVFFFFAIFFWAGFEQAGSSLSLYTDKFIDRTVLGYTIPTSSFQAVNALFIVVLAGVFGWFWNTPLGRRLSTPSKMGLGLIFLGIGFFFMLGAVAERGGDIQDETVKASLMWLVMTYLLHTIGELCISPVGLSVVTKLSPPRLASLLMGVWLLSSFFANILGGFLAKYVESLGAGTIFLYIAIFVIACGTVLLALNKTLVKMMHGVK
ncbi:MAG: peptide MFS transporter [Cloacibacterium sp.]|jgi:POT family proton-dependent oligopeptide transporter|nr:peptide MFS transporter [Cloacibacterium sp.]